MAVRSIRASRVYNQARQHPQGDMVRKYRNTIQNPYEVASAANARGSLQTSLSKVTLRSKATPRPGQLRRVTFDRSLTFLGHLRNSVAPTRRPHQHAPRGCVWLADRRRGSWSLFAPATCDNFDPHMKKTVILIAYALFVTGGLLILISILMSRDWPVLAAFVRDIGLLLSAIMGGTILHEKVLRDEMARQFIHELDRKLESKVPKLSEIDEKLQARIPKLSDIDEKLQARIPTLSDIDEKLLSRVPKLSDIDEKLQTRIPSASEIASQTAGRVHELFSERPPGMTGIKLIPKAEHRRNFWRYYSWVNEQKPQELFFAGRSVLHRINADIWTRTGGYAQDILLRRLKEGSKVTILFLDPRIDLLQRLATEEGQQPNEMLEDIATSVGICLRLHGLLRNNLATLPPNAELKIRIYDRVPYFAYHKQDSDVILGFYFLSEKGSSSAPYEIVDDTTKAVFGGHFDRIFAMATAGSLLEFDGPRRRLHFDENLFNSLRDFLAAELGSTKSDDLLNRRIEYTEAARPNIPGPDGGSS
jgi:hypothetical protein